MVTLKSIAFLSIITFACSPKYVQYDRSGCEKAKLKNYDRAIIDFDKAINSNKYYWPSYSNRGGYFLINEDYQNAMSNFNKSISLHKKNEYAYDGRGIAKELTGDTLGAISDYRTALKYHKTNNNIYSHLGIILAKVDSCSEAIRYLNLAITYEAFNDCISKSQLLYLKSKCESSLIQH